MRADVYRSRTFDRRRFDLRVKVVYRREGRNNVIHGRTSDLSFSGIGLVLTREIASGTACVLVMRFPRTEVELQLPAVVAQRRGFRCGLRFESLSGEQKLLIQKICKALP